MALCGREKNLSVTSQSMVNGIFIHFKIFHCKEIINYGILINIIRHYDIPLLNTLVYVFFFKETFSNIAKIVSHIGK